MMLYTYSIVPLSEKGFDEICEDIRFQYEHKISSTPLFKMVLVPEGDPLWKKCESNCALYERYRDKLSEYGVETGVLIQASLGHGYPLVSAPFQKIVNFTDGDEADAYCPEDKNFTKHFKDVVKKIASQHPKAIMLDDDVRLVMRPGRGCACPLHMAKFKERTNCDMNRRELWEYVRTHPDDDPLTLAFLDIQRESLVNFVTELRDAIDSVDPTIQGISCTSGDECDSVIYTNPIFAGKDNPTIVRVPNGTYAPETVRGFSDIMRRAKVCKTKLQNAGIDIVLAESDTIPYNRYGKNARYLHSHYTASILEGLMGAKHWITRFSSGELGSGKAFRDILAKHYPFYERLSSIAPKIKWVGINSMFIEQKYHSYSKDIIWRYHTNDWVKYVFERLGIPFYYSDKNDGIAFLEGDIVSDMSDKQLESVFEGAVFADSVAASDIVKRGFGHMLGVSLKDADGITVNGETFDGTLASICTKQNKLKIIEPLGDDTKVISYNYAKKGSGLEIVSPAVTSFKRPDGNLSVVYCGIPTAEFNYIEGFAFLNETRKRQFISLIKEAGDLPVYYEGDTEICLRAGYIEDGSLLLAVYNLSYDPLETFEVYLKSKPESISIINPDGTDSCVEFTEIGNDIYSINTRVEPLYPVVLIVK